MEERKNSPFQSHRLLLEDRQRGTVTGVMDVKSFNVKSSFYWQQNMA